MVQKFWSDMTHDEKLDVLRNDIERLFAAINSTNSNVSQLDEGMTELFTRLTIMQKKRSTSSAEKAVVLENAVGAGVRLRKGGHDTPPFPPHPHRPRPAGEPQQERRKRLDRPPWGLVHHRPPRPAHDRGRAGNWPILD